MKPKKTGIVSLLILLLLVTGIPAAFAQSPPSVQTCKPTKMYVDYLQGPPSVQDVRARLNGTVNPNGSDCSVYFEYGATLTYGSVADASPSTVSGSSEVSVSASLTGLSVNTVYHCRLVAVSDGAIYYGHDLAFIPSSDPGDINIYGDHTINGITCRQIWESRFVTSTSPTGNIEIVAAPSDSPTMAEFDITNHNSFDVSVDYADDANGYQFSGTLVLGACITQQIYVFKNSLAAFSYDGNLFKQMLTNDQTCSDTPLPQNNIEIYYLGYLDENSAGVDSPGVYSINNRNAQAVSLDVRSGSSSYTVSVPANGIVYFISPVFSEVILGCDNKQFAVASPSWIKWHGAALVTVNPLGSIDNTATFELQNNDVTAHKVKLKNADGTTHSYSLAPYGSQIVTIEKSDWDLYLDMNLPQANLAGLVEDGYVNISSVSPGTSPVQFQVSRTTVSMGAAGGSSTLVQVLGSTAWTAVSDQTWLTVSPASGSTDQMLTFTAEANPAAVARSANVTISDGPESKTIVVTQAPLGQDNALHFDGINDYVSIPDNDAGITDAVTLETWVKWEPDSPSDIQFICGKQPEQLEIQAGGSPNGIRFIPATGVYLDAANALPVGVWTHVAVVYRPSAALAKMYINGNEVALTNNGSQPLTSALINSATAFCLGSRSDGSYRFKGALDNFRIWNRALTQNEIRLDMLNNPVGTERQAGLVSSYDFNNGIAEADNAGVTDLTDEMGNFNGVLNNFALTGTSSNWVASGAASAAQGFTVTYDANGADSGTVPTDSLKYVSGATATVQAAGGLAKTGGSFSGWNTSAGGSGIAYAAAADLNIETSNVTLYAQWTPDQSITTGTISGTVTYGSIPVEGATVGLTVSGSVYSAATAANGSYSIVNVPAETGYTVTATKSGYNSGSATNVSVTTSTTTQNVNIALTATPTATHTVSVFANPAEGGTVAGGNTYSEGASVTVTASVYSGYNFINWTEDNVQVSANSTYTFTMGAADRSLTANFATVTTAAYSVNVTASPTAGGTVNGGGTYAQGANVMVTATPNSGYSFVYWTENSSEVSTSSAYMLRRPVK